MLEEAKVGDLILSTNYYEIVEIKERPIINQHDGSVQRIEKEYFGHLKMYGKSLAPIKNNFVSKWLGRGPLYKVQKGNLDRSEKILFDRMAKAEDSLNWIAHLKEKYDL